MPSEPPLFGSVSGFSQEYQFQTGSRTWCKRSWKHLPFLAMSWACARMIKAATTKHGSTSTLSDGMVHTTQREKPCPRILLKERSSPYHYGKEGGRISDMSDHSLSSWHRDHSRTPVRQPTSRVLRASSPSDLMTLPVLSDKSCSFSLLIIHVACMTIPTRRATKKWIISLTTASSSPLTSFSDIIAPGYSTKSTAISAPLPSSVKLPNTFLKKSTFILALLLPHLDQCTPLHSVSPIPLPFFCVFREISRLHTTPTTVVSSFLASQHFTK